MTDISFGERLKALIQKQGKTQKEIAENLGVSSSAVNLWTKGGEIGYDKLRQLARLLDTNWVWLRYGEDAYDELVKELCGERRDISSLNEMRRQQLDRRLKNEERLSRAVEMAGVVVWDWNYLSDVIVCTPNAPELFGLNPTSFKDFLCIVHPEDSCKLTRILNQALENDNERCQYDYRIIQANGNVRWMMASARPLRDRTGEKVGLTGVVWDITERKKAYHERCRMRERLELALSATNAGLFEYDYETDEYYCTERTAEIFGIACDQMKNRSDVTKAVHPEDRDKILMSKAALSHLNVGDRIHSEYRLRNPATGEVKPIRAYGVIAESSTGHGRRVVGIVVETYHQPRNDKVLLS